MIFWPLWPFECLLLMILTMTKYHEHLLKESTLSLLSMVKFFSSSETKIILKIPSKSFLRITQYHLIYCHFQEHKSKSLQARYMAKGIIMNFPRCRFIF